MYEIKPYLRWVDLVVKVNRKYYLYGKHLENPLSHYLYILDILKGDY